MAALLAKLAPMATSFAKTQGKALLNQGKKQAVNFTMAHKNQAINLTKKYLNNKARKLGSAVNARVNATIAKVGPPRNNRNLLKR